MLVVLFTITSCTNKETTIEQAMKISNIMFDSLVHVKEIKNRDLAIVYYEYNHELGLGLLEKKRNGWVWEIGTIESETDSELSWGYSNLKQMVPMFHGVINNKAIERVVIETNDFKKEAEIIQMTDKKLWLVLLEKPQDPPVKIFGYNKQGEVIYSNEK